MFLDESGIDFNKTLVSLFGMNWAEEMWYFQLYDYLILQFSFARASLGRPKKVSRILFPVFGTREMPKSFVKPFCFRLILFALCNLLFTFPVLSNVWIINSVNFSIPPILKINFDLNCNNISPEFLSIVPSIWSIDTLISIPEGKGGDINFFLI